MFVLRVGSSSGVVVWSLLTLCWCREASFLFSRWCIQYGLSGVKENAIWQLICGVRACTLLVAVMGILYANFHSLCNSCRYPVNGVMNYVAWIKGKNGQKADFFTDGMQLVTMLLVLWCYYSTVSWRVIYRPPLTVWLWCFVGSFDPCFVRCCCEEWITSN